MNPTLETAKGRVMKAIPLAWYCDCGCHCVYEKSRKLGCGDTEEEAWRDAEQDYRVQSFYKARP